MRFRDFLRHRIPYHEIIVGHHPELRHFLGIGEKAGVLVRHGWLHRKPGWPPQFGPVIYNGDESYPPRPEMEHQEVCQDFHRLFVVNCRSIDQRVTALPVGIYPNRTPWRVPLALIGTKRSKLAYCNFSLGNVGQPHYTAKRNKVYNELKKHSWITFENMGNTHGNYSLCFTTYYRHVAGHMFTVSPEGNGVDCHRTWEALYLKSVPIVQRSPEMNHFQDLPILYTDDYTELTPSYLRRVYSQMLDTEYNIKELYSSYWRSLIQIEIDKGRNQ